MCPSTNSNEFHVNKGQWRRQVSSLGCLKNNYLLLIKILVEKLISIAKIVRIEKIPP